METAITIEHDSDNNEFYSIVNGQTSRLSYVRLPDGKTLDFQSTYVPVELRGRRIGYYLVEAGLRYAQDNGLTVIPSCPFVKKFADNHPEYRDIITPL